MENKKYVIVTDSTTDLPEKLLRELDLTVLPLSYTMNGETFLDTTEKSKVSAFYAKLRDGNMASTSQINVETFRECFEKLISEGNDVLYLGFSSGISGTYQSSRIARDDMLEKYPESVVEVVDTKCASMGEGLIVYYAAKLKESGKTLSEVRDWVEENKLRINHWFTVDDLNFLKRGGRISSAAAMIGGLLGIKPVMDTDSQGKLRPVSKVRGRKKALDELVNRMEALVENPEEQIVFISHGDVESDAKYVECEVRRRFKVIDVVISYVGATIGAHSGPGTVALFFLGKNRLLQI